MCDIMDCSQVSFLVRLLNEPHGTVFTRKGLPVKMDSVDVADEGVIPGEGSTTHLADEPFWKRMGCLEPLETRYRSLNWQIC